PGDKVKAKLIEIDAERRRISLSIKQTTERPADLPADDDFVPIDASGEGLDLDGPSTSMAQALREAASRARGEDEVSGEEAPADDETPAATAEGESKPEDAAIEPTEATPDVAEAPGDAPDGATSVDAEPVVEPASTEVEVAEDTVAEATAGEEAPAAETPEVAEEAATEAAAGEDVPAAEPEA
ncbi:MAG: hypothetical protein JWM86_1890, partial [Thermoleophilia bacterium]|nr:hypothetical protein [Thermoleophilia bacterium]